MTEPAAAVTYHNIALARYQVRGHRRSRNVRHELDSGVPMRAPPIPCRFGDGLDSGDALEIERDGLVRQPAPGAYQKPNFAAGSGAHPHREARKQVDVPSTRTLRSALRGCLHFAGRVVAGAVSQS